MTGRNLLFAAALLTATTTVSATPALARGEVQFVALTRSPEAGLVQIAALKRDDTRELPQDIDLLALQLQLKAGMHARAQVLSDEVASRFTIPGVQALLAYRVHDNDTFMRVIDDEPGLLSRVQHGFLSAEAARLQGNHSDAYRQLQKLGASPLQRYGLYNLLYASADDAPLATRVLKDLLKDSRSTEVSELQDRARLLAYQRDLLPADALKDVTLAGHYSQLAIHQLALDARNNGDLYLAYDHLAFLSAHQDYAYRELAALHLAETIEESDGAAAAFAAYENSVGLLQHRHQVLTQVSQRSREESLETLLPTLRSELQPLFASDEFSSRLSDWQRLCERRQWLQDQRPALALLVNIDTRQRRDLDDADQQLVERSYDQQAAALSAQIAELQHELDEASTFTIDDRRLHRFAHATERRDLEDIDRLALQGLANNRRLARLRGAVLWQIFDSLPQRLQPLREQLEQQAARQQTLTRTIARIVAAAEQRQQTSGVSWQLASLEQRVIVSEQQLADRTSALESQLLASVRQTLAQQLAEVSHLRHLGLLATARVADEMMLASQAP